MTIQEVAERTGFLPIRSAFMKRPACSRVSSACRMASERGYAKLALAETDLTIPLESDTNTGKLLLQVQM